MRQVVAFLKPTILRQFENFRRPWPEDMAVSPAMSRARRTVVHEERLVRLVSDFLGDVPQLLAFEIDAVPDPPEVACGESIRLRRTGQGYQAACALRKTIIGSGGANDILRVHHMDILTQLGVYRTDIGPIDEDRQGCIATAVVMFAYASQIYQRLPLYDFLDTAISEHSQDTMIGVPWTYVNAEELYAKICYVHTYIAVSRFTQVVEGHSTQTRLSRSAQALERLLELWRNSEAGLHLNQTGFLRWRCGQALHECVPFSQPTLGLTRGTDLFTAVVTSSQPRSDELVEVIKTWVGGGDVAEQHFSILATYIEGVIQRRNFRQLDELLQGVQLIDHPSLTSLRKAFRSLSWQLHRHMNPTSPWVSDSGLQHPLHLWVAVREREGAFNLGLDREQVRPPSERDYDVSGRWQSINHLRFGFGELNGRLASRKWVYSWSILYQCLQHTPSPFQDCLYSLLFAHSDFFSWSQVCQRLRHICRTCLFAGSDCDDLLLDGVTPEHSNLAGLDSLQMTDSAEHPLENLNEKIVRLRKLRDSVQELVQRQSSLGPSGPTQPTVLRFEGLLHLAGLLLAWEGQARFEYASQLSETLIPISTQHKTSTKGSEDVWSELRRAQETLQQAYAEGRTMKYGLVLRIAADSLLALHDRMYKVGQLLGRNTNSVSMTASRVTLCDNLEDNLRAGVIQALSTPGYRFAAGNSQFSTRTPSHKITKLYQVMQTALYCQGRFEEAAQWSENESNDVAVGETMALMQPVAGGDRPGLSSDAEIAISVEQFPTKQQRDEFMKHTVVPDAPSPTPGMKSPTADVNGLIRAIPPVIGPSKVIQFGCNDEQIIVYATDMQGKVRSCPCDMTRDRLHTNTEFSSMKTITNDTVQMFRVLDALAESIAHLTVPDELLILIPSVVCREVPFQALETGQGTERIALGVRNPIVYAPTPYLVQRCIEKGLDAERATKRQRRMAVATVFASAKQSAEDKLAETAQYLAKELDGTAILKGNVTFKRMLEEFRQREWLFFLGHGAQGANADGTLSFPRLFLQGNEVFDQYHLAHTVLPDTCLCLFGCHLARVRVRGEVEYQSLALTSLIAGSLVTLGTMYGIWTSAARKLSRKLAARLKPYLERREGHEILDMARTLQALLKEMQTDMGPEMWGPFVLHGTPMLLIGQEESTRKP